MLCELPYHRLLILTEGALGVFTSKTGSSVLRYRPDDCAGVLDSKYAGQPIHDHLEAAPDVPIFANVADALSCRPDAVLIGVAPPGGALPPTMRRHLREALEHGLSIISGLHTMLAADPELAELAAAHNGRIHDVRNPGHLQHIARGRARQLPVRRVLTVGTDCDIGKMVTALALRDEAVRRGLDAAFVATGQTGIMIEGWGIAVDHVLSDFTAGAAELLAQHVADRAICFIEGQGSIAHPAYGPVTLGLLLGTCPDAMVMVHRPDRRLHNGWEDCPLPPIDRQIALYEASLAPLHPGKVVAIAVNTAGLSDAEARQAVEAVQAQTQLPAADPIRHGCSTLLDAIHRHLDAPE